MLDTLSAAARHLILGAITAGVATILLYLQAHQSDFLTSVPAAWAPIAGVVFTTALTWFTTLTRQYGVGAGNGDGDIPVQDTP